MSGLLAKAQFRTGGNSATAEADVTIARWLLPSGEWIHDEGIPVNIEIADNPDTEEDEQLLRAIEEL